jgi:hypothetical protein
VLGADLAPLRPAEDRGCIDQSDLDRGGILADVQEQPDPNPERLDRILGAGFRGLRHDVVRDLALHLAEDRAEEVALVAEVVVEGAAGDARTLDELLGADGRVAALREQFPSRGEESGPRGLPSRGTMLRFHTDCLYVTLRADHTGCMST